MMARENLKLPTTAGPGKLITESPLQNSYLDTKNFITEKQSVRHSTGKHFPHNGRNTFGIRESP